MRGAGTVRRVLAYVFWHVPADDVAAADYEARLSGFHTGLRDGSTDGLGSTGTVALAEVPWLGERRPRPGLVPRRRLRGARHAERAARLRRARKLPH